MAVCSRGFACCDMARRSDVQLSECRDDVLRERRAVRINGPLGTVKPNVEQLCLEHTDLREATLMRLMSDAEPTELQEATERAGDVDGIRRELDMERRAVLSSGPIGIVKDRMDGA